MIKILSLLALMAPLFALNAATDDSLTSTQTACKAFVAKISAMPGVTYGTVQVPEDWSNPSGPKLPLFWWKRAGTQPGATPMAFIHGGVAGNSWAIFDKWQEVLAKYPGDLVAFDHRGEGCSKTLPSNLEPSAYKYLRVRSVVRDMEYLRTQVFGYSQWRVVGHSRGSSLIHYYLEMAPEGLESAHAMGFSITPAEQQSLYTLTRAQGFYDTAKLYLLRYPQDEAQVKMIRSLIKPDTCWLALDDRKVCGPAVLDIFAQFLSRVSAWADLHTKLSSMVDFNSTYAAIQARLPLDVYGNFNYVIGTNGRDFGSPDSLMTDLLRTNPVYTEPFLSEVRYLGEALRPSININWRSTVDPLDHSKIKAFLASHPNFRYYLYSGALDPIAPPISYQWEVEFLGPLVNFVKLPNSAHDGWFDPILINNILAK